MSTHLDDGIRRIYGEAKEHAEGHQMTADPTYQTLQCVLRVLTASGDDMDDFKRAVISTWDRSAR